METRLQIRQVAKATSIRFERQRDDLSFISQDSTGPVTTGYEEVLANSDTYLRTRYKAKPPSYNSVSSIKDRVSNYIKKEKVPTLSIGNTMLVINDYMTRLPGHLDLAKGDFVKILEKKNGRLWLGESHGRIGKFPIGSCDTSVGLIGSDIENQLPPPSAKPFHPSRKSSDYTAGAMFLFILLIIVVWLIHTCVGFFMEYISNVRPFTSDLVDRYPVYTPVYTDVEDPLLAAAAAGSIKTVSKLINSYTHDPAAGALLATAAFGSVDKTSELLEQGIKPSIRDSKLRTPLHLAAANGNNETIALLLKYKTGWFAEDNITPLHLAARYGHASAVLLITRTSSHDGSGERATFPQATRKLQVSTGKAFGQQLAKFFARKTFSARELAVIFGHGTTALAFPNRKSDYHQAFSCASMLGDAQLVEALWDHHMQLRWHQRHGSLGEVVRWFPAPPLHLAVMSGSPATVAFLLEQGMDPNDQSSRSISRWMTDAFPAYSAAAHYAAILGSTRLLLILKQRGADLAALDHRSRTPLSYAVENLNTEAVEFLVKQKYRNQRYLGSGHTWQDKKRKVDGVPNKRVKNALKSLGSKI